MDFAAFAALCPAPARLQRVAHAALEDLVRVRGRRLVACDVLPAPLVAIVLRVAQADSVCTPGLSSYSERGFNSVCPVCVRRVRFADERCCARRGGRAADRRMVDAAVHRGTERCCPGGARRRLHPHVLHRTRGCAGLRLGRCAAVRVTGSCTD